MLDGEGKVKGVFLAEQRSGLGYPEGLLWGYREPLLWGGGKAGREERGTLGRQIVWFISCLCPFPAV